jgi:hypothetical protein
MVHRCRHKDVVASKRDRGAVRGMQALLFDIPCHPAVATHTEPDGGGGHHDAGTVRVRTNLVNVAIDINGRLPRDTTVGRPRDTADVDVCEEDRAVRGCSDRADPQRRPHALTVDHCRARIPRITPRNVVEAAELLDSSVRVDAQKAGVLRSDIDHVAHCHATREIDLCGRHCAPHTVWRTSAK